METSFWLTFACFIFMCCDSASASDWTPLSSSGQCAKAGGITFNFGQADDERDPGRWLGPIVITSPSGRSCQVSENVEIIHRPIDLWRARLLYVDTYSGSALRLFVVDLRTCKIAWASPAYYGPEPFIGDHRLRLDGHAPTTSVPMDCRQLIDDNCPPQSGTALNRQAAFC